MRTRTALFSDPRTNCVLRAIPMSDWSRCSAYLEPVHLAIGQVLSEPGCIPGYMFFPTTAVVSLLYVSEDGASTELAFIGNEGMVGISLLMGGSAMPYQAVVQSAGLGFRLRAQIVIDEIERSGAVLQLLLRYAQTLMEQVAQTAACNRYYSTDQLLCRRLLLALDRIPSGVLMMIQELLANLPGVRREGMTVAALQQWIWARCERALRYWSAWQH